MHRDTVSEIKVESHHGRAARHQRLTSGLHRHTGSCIMCTLYHKHKGKKHTNIHKIILRHRKVVKHSKHHITAVNLHVPVFKEGYANVTKQI